MAPPRASHRRLIIAVALLVTLVKTAGTSASHAEERIFPVPRVTIYPGDLIRESMLDERSFSYAAEAEESAIDSKSALVGKIAKRTLLPGKPISQIAVDSPRLVVIGAQVKVIFSEDGLMIATYGTALQSGAAGDLVRVRNQDSGLTISGRVQPDGSIRVSEG